MRPVCLPEKYEILETLGSGGMGTVWRARDRTLDREVALKVLSDRFADDPQFVQRFTTEARAAASLNHPNIVQIYEFGQTDRGHFLAMELVDGPSLKAELKQRGRFSETETLAVARQVCAALAVAHAAGIVHRDIKPDNMMFTRDRRFKLVDLGLAKKLSDDTSQTVTGQSLGTPHFISPEQILGAGEIDGRADIYSLGATAYYLATGTVPFDGTTGAHIMSRHLNDLLPDPRRVAPDLSGDFCRMLGRMMAKDPAHRHQDIIAVDGDLQALQRGEIIERVAPVATAVQDTIFISSPDLSAETAAVVWDDDDLRRLTTALVRHIGPLAKVLIKQAQATALSREQMIDDLASHIQVTADRKAFLAKCARLARGDQTTDITSGRAWDPGATMPLSSQPAPGAADDGSSAGSGPVQVFSLADETRAEIARALTDQIGPVASILVNREAAVVRDLAELTQRLAANIPDSDGKRVFLAAMERLA